MEEETKHLRKMIEMKEKKTRKNNIIIKGEEMKKKTSKTEF